MTAQEATKLSRRQLERLARDPNQALGVRFAASRELDLRALGYRRNREQVTR